jgi:two-component system, OmpR family, sensor kinase
VTLVFAGIMAFVLGATGVFIYLRYESELNMTIDAGLRSRAADVAALVRDSNSGLQPTQREVEGSQSFAEVIDGEGRVEDSTLARAGAVRLGAEQVAAAERGPLFIEDVLLPETGDRAKLLVVPVRGENQSRVVVVGTDTEARDEALTDLLQLLLIGGPVALLLASIAGYGVAAAALRPVEAMRSRAADISAAVPDQRLPVPPSRDEIARLGTTLNEMLDRLGEAIEHERSFVADASHELRTPLAILRTELELALSEGRTPEELRAALASAAEETDRLNQLSEDLLTIAQTERGELPLKVARMDLEQTFDAVRIRFSRRAEEGARSIEVDGGATELVADQLRLDQAIGNMVDNALRYGEGPIALRAAEREDTVDIHVTDRGPGFPIEFRERAFERFSQRSPDRGDRGSGLGLAIVRTVARAHGGEAYAGNLEGGGADVWMRLPAHIA